MARDNRSKMDPTQISQITYDGALEAIRVTVLPMEMSVELDADDGDSVMAVKAMTTMTVVSGEVIDTSKVSRICAISEDTAAILEIKAVIGDLELDLMSLNMLQIKELCIPKITCQVTSDAPVHLILQA